MFKVIGVLTGQRPIENVTETTRVMRKRKCSPIFYTTFLLQAIKVIRNLPLNGLLMIADVIVMDLMMFFRDSKRLDNKT